MKCPYCAEEILDDAIVCRHCGRDFILLKPLHEKLKSLQDRITVLEENYATLHQTASNEVLLIQPAGTQNSLSIVIAGLLTYITLAALMTLIWLSSDLPFFLSLISYFSLPLIIGMAVGYRWGSRGIIELGLLVLIVDILLTGITRVNSGGGYSYGYNLSNALTLSNLSYSIGIGLLLISSGFTGSWLYRKIHPDAKRSGIIVRVAQSLAGKANIPKAEKKRRAEAIAAYITAVAPLLTFLATVIGALLTYLSAVNKAK